jgi:hypothetical protein
MMLYLDCKEGNEVHVYCILFGDPTTGFSLYGPFGSINGARAWARDTFGSQMNWWVDEITDPSDAVFDDPVDPAQH